VRIIPLEQFLEEQDFFLEEAWRSKIFVYPTDTIYGLWAVVNPYTSKTIDTIKQRLPWKHYSLIAPNEHWIVDNFEVEYWFMEQRYARKTQYCFNKWYERGMSAILQLRKWRSFPWSWKNENWVRIINHPIQEFVNELWQPFITTSANISWDINLVSQPSDLTKEQCWLIDYFIYSEIKNTEWSVIIDWESGNILRN
jgi:tRNA A37 threonylcarbamoyladenosine synthetase subunit TsaC/SUA5/YrdC